MFADIRTPVRLYPSCGSNNSSKLGPFENNMSFEKLCSKLPEGHFWSWLLQEASYIDLGVALFEAKKEQKIIFISTEEKPGASSKSGKY